jgi:hypothetical protein
MPCEERWLRGLPLVVEELLFHLAVSLRIDVD